MTETPESDQNETDKLDPAQTPESAKPQDPAKPLDPVAVTILELLEAAGPGGSIEPGDAARAFAAPRARKSDPKDVWRRYLPAARQQALHLARAGRIVILRKGEPADPHAPIKGLIKLALPK